MHQEENSNLAAFEGREIRKAFHEEAGGAKTTQRLKKLDEE